MAEEKIEKPPANTKEWLKSHREAANRERVKAAAEELEHSNAQHRDAFEARQAARAAVAKESHKREDEARERRNANLTRYLRQS